MSLFCFGEEKKEKLLQRRKLQKAIKRLYVKSVLLLYEIGRLKKMLS